MEAASLAGRVVAREHLRFCKDGMAASWRRPTVPTAALCIRLESKQMQSGGTLMRGRCIEGVISFNPASA